VREGEGTQTHYLDGAGEDATKADAVIPLKTRLIWRMVVFVFAESLFVVYGVRQSRGS
jgi:hypothetical protein